MFFIRGKPFIVPWAPKVDSMNAHGGLVAGSNENGESAAYSGLGFPVILGDGDYLFNAADWASPSPLTRLTILALSASLTGMNGGAA